MFGFLHWWFVDYPTGLWQDVLRDLGPLSLLGAAFITLVQLVVTVLVAAVAVAAVIKIVTGGCRAVARAARFAGRNLRAGYRQGMDR